MSVNRRKVIAFGAGAAAVAATGGVPARAEPHGVPNAALARSLAGGFRSEYATVNGTRLHYVIGGRGEPLVLLPGWPQIWWQFNKIMPVLAHRYRVIAVDLRGMGGSAKPPTGYDKKTMARDIYELVRHLGYDGAFIAGHDIGSMVAFSFAVNHPSATRKVALMDVPHPDDKLYELRMVPRPGEFHLWWFAFNQVLGLPEQLLAGRSRYLVDWLLDHLAFHPDAIGERDRDVYARAYARPDAIRAGNAWYQTLSQDIEDQKAYGPVTAPMLGLGGELGFDVLANLLPLQGTDVRVVKVAGSGHFLAEERPEEIIQQLNGFLG